MTPKCTVGAVGERYALNQLKAQGRADSRACLAWRRLALQPLPPQPIEQIGVRTLRKRGERAGSHEPRS